MAMKSDKKKGLLSVDSSFTNQYLRTLREIADGDGVLDLEGNFISFDQKTQAVLLKRSKEMEGVSFNSIFVDKSIKSMLEQVKTKNIFSDTFLIDSSFGQKMVEIYFVLDENKILFFIKDLSLRQKYVDEEIIRVGTVKEIESLKEMQRSKQQILRITSHELKTPLTPMKLELQMLLEDKTITPPQRKGLVNIHNALDHFQYILERVIKVSKLETETLLLHISTISARKLVEEVIDIFQGVAKDKKIILTADLKEVGSVKWDPVQVKEVIHNLLDNAFKYTDKGKIMVSLKKIKGFILISVKDTGIGMNLKVQKNLFTPFYQADYSDIRSHGGSGMGLAIVKGIAEAHGGTVSVISKADNGSTFTLSLPIVVNQKELGV